MVDREVVLAAEATVRFSDEYSEVFTIKRACGKAVFYRQTFEHDETPDVSIVVNGQVLGQVNR